MRPEILGIFVPIIFLIGLFTAISLNIYYKYKARVATADHAQGESLDAWCKAEAMAKASVSRSASLRLGGFLTGAGLGSIVGIFVGRIPAMWQFFGSFADSQHYDYHDVQLGFQMTLLVFFVMALAILCGGLGMIGASFLDRALNGKNHKSDN